MKLSHLSLGPVFISRGNCHVAGSSPVVPATLLLMFSNTSADSASRVQTLANLRSAPGFSDFPLTPAIASFQSRAVAFCRSDRSRFRRSSQDAGRLGGVIRPTSWQRTNRVERGPSLASLPLIQLARQRRSWSVLRHSLGLDQILSDGLPVAARQLPDRPDANPCRFNSPISIPFAPHNRSCASAASKLVHGFSRCWTVGCFNRYL